MPIGRAGEGVRIPGSPYRSRADDEAFERWLQNDPANRAAYAAYVRMRNVAGRVRDDPVLAARVGAELRRFTASRTSSLRSSLAGWRLVAGGALAAAVMLALARVQVSAAGGRELFEPVVLTAGMKLVQGGNHPMTVATADAKRVLTWRQVNRYLPKPMVVDDAALLRDVISGRFRIGDADAIRFALSGRFDLAVVEERDRVVLRRIP